MTDKLRGAFHGCPHHGDDYEACIQHSGTAPCGVTEELEHTQGQRDDAIQRAQAAEGRADALSAHVELWRLTSRSVRHGLDFALRYSQGHAETSMQAVRREQDRLAEMEAQQATTSLAQHAARMRAEGGESALVQVAVEMRKNNSRGTVADLYGLASHLEKCAGSCRRQAGEASQ